jgi:hypothetical protein
MAYYMVVTVQGCRARKKTLRRQGNARYQEKLTGPVAAGEIFRRRNLHSARVRICEGRKLRPINIALEKRGCHEES